MKKTTRHNILDVALSVFSHRGVIHTTMDDVAKASGYGRRTLYTYFKNRDELFEEVIFKERKVIIGKLNTVIGLNAPTNIKMENIMLVHMNVIEDLVNRNESLRQEFIKRNDRIDYYRSEIDNHQKYCIEFILNEGSTNGTYTLADPQTTASIILSSLKGLEKMFILEGFGTPAIETLKLFNNIILKGIETP